MRAILFGCGGSQGVPTADGDWGACDPANPRNYRRRASVLVEAATAAGEPRRILIDTSTDLREQVLRAGIRRIDAVLYTHPHADHVHGIDELRSFNRAMGQPIPIWAVPATLEEIRRRFSYAVEPPSGPAFHRPTLVPHPIDGPFEAAGIPVIPFAQDHGVGPSTGFRIGDFAYSTDVVGLSEAAFAALAGVAVWVVDCVRLEPHFTHSHLARTLDWIARVRPRRAILTHMDHSLDYDALTRLLPPGVEAGYDGLVIEV
jgi:phosphoribosyl 1,2-cyclic phosphate phosphodiesterase